MTEATIPEATWPTVPEVARRCNASVRTVKRRIAAGQLRAVAVMGIVRVCPDDLAHAVQPRGPRRRASRTVRTGKLQNPELAERRRGMNRAAASRRD